MSKQSIKFSIIVPVYNVQQYLEECINNILEQSYDNFEIILVDDGSTDGSGKICDSYALRDNRIIVVHKENAGVSSARNSGIAVAQGDYVFFVDADDYWCRDGLSSIAETINKHIFPDIVYINGNYLRMPKGSIVKYSCGLNAKEFNALNGERVLEYMLNKPSDNLWSICRAAYRIDVIKKNKIYFELGVTLAEDADWLFRFLFYTKKCVLFETPFYVYRVNRAGSAMITKSKRSLETFLQIVLKWIYDFNKDPKSIKKIICTKFSNNYVEYFKYFFFYDEVFCNKLIAEIEASHMLDFVDSPYANSVRKKIQKKGFKRVLRNLNSKFKLRQFIKFLVVRLNFIDR